MRATASSATTTAAVSGHELTILVTAKDFVAPLMSPTPTSARCPERTAKRRTAAGDGLKRTTKSVRQAPR